MGFSILIRFPFLIHVSSRFSVNESILKHRCYWLWYSLFQLRLENNAINVSRQKERRTLESEIASLKSVLNDNICEKEKIDTQRRKTLFNAIKSKPVSPIKIARGINCSRRKRKLSGLKEIDENSKFQPSPEAVWDHQQGEYWLYCVIEGIWEPGKQPERCPSKEQWIPEEDW